MTLSTAERPGRAGMTLVATCLGFFMIQLDVTIVNVALPSIQSELNATPDGLEWTVNAYLLTLGTLIALGGKLGDRFGRRRLFYVGLAVFTASSAACALAGTVPQLIAARAFQGAGAAILTPMSLALVTGAFPPERVPTAIGIWGAVAGLGMASGPVVGGLLVDGAGWSAVFWVNVPLAAVVALIASRAIAESRDRTILSLDLPGTALLTTALFALLYGLIETNEHAFGSAHTLGFLSAAAVVLALFVVRQTRTAEPMVPVSLFQHRIFTVSVLVAMLAGFGLLGAIYSMTLYFQNVQGYSALQAGLRTLPSTLPVLMVAPAVGRVLGRVGVRPFIAGGILTFAVGIIGLAFLEPQTPYSQIWPFLLVAGIGFTMVLPAVTIGAMLTAGAAKSGVAAGVMNSFRQVGSALGIAVLGAIGASATRAHLSDSLAAADAGTGGAVSNLEELALIGQTEAATSLAGPQAGRLVGEAFTKGLQPIALTISGLCLGAGLMTLIMLRGQRGVVDAALPEVRTSGASFHTEGSS